MNEENKTNEATEQEPIEQASIEQASIEQASNEQVPIEQEPNEQEPIKKAPTKKKRGCFINGCLVLGIINFSLTVILLCVGWIAGDQFTRQRLNMSLTETFGLVRNISRSDGKFIENAPQEGDEAAFYDSLGGALMLKNGVVKGDDLKNTVIDSLKNNEDLGTAFGNYAINLLNSENFDQSKINAIGEIYDERYNLKISDREFAAFANGVIGVMADAFVVDMLKEAELDKYGVNTDNFNVDSYIRIEQIKIYKNEDIDMMKGTVSVNFKQFFNELKANMDYGKLIDNGMPEAKAYSGFIQFGIKTALRVVQSILPDKLYLTIDMGLSGSAEPSFAINNMNEEQMNKLYALLDKINVKIDPNSSKTFKEQLNDVFIGEDSEIKKTIDDLKLGDILSKEGGGLDCNIYQFIIDAAKLNYKNDEEGNEILKDPAEQIGAIDILQTFKLILSDDNAKYLDTLGEHEHAYKNVKFKYENNELYLDENGMPVIEEQGKKYYKTEVSEELLAAYERQILSSFAHEYGLKDGYTINEIIDNFSDNFNADEAIKMFDSQRIKEMLKKDKVIGVTFDDKMLAALLMKMTEKEDFRKNAEFEFVYVENEDYQNVEHNILHVGVTIKIRDLINDLVEGNNEDTADTEGNEDNEADQNNLISKIVKNLLPEYFVAEAALDVTINVGEEGYKSTSILLNGKQIGVIDKMAVAFGIFPNDNGENQTLGEYIDNSLTPVRELIENMSEILPGLNITESGLELPNVYAALTKIVDGDKTEGEEGYINADMIECSLKLITDDTIFSDGDYAFFADQARVDAFNQNSENALVKELNQKYGLKASDDNGEPFTLSEILHVMKIVKLSKPGKVERLEIYDLIDPDGIRAQAREGEGWEQNLKVNIVNETFKENEQGNDMLTALIKKVIENKSDMNYGPLGNFDINKDLLFVKIAEENGKKYLEINVRATIKDLLPSGEEGEIKRFIEDILPSSASLITLKIDITSKASTDCSVIVNGNEKSSEVMFNMLSALDMDIDFTEMGKAVRDAFFGIEEQNINFDYSDDGLTLPCIFEIIDSVVLENGHNDNGASVKAAFEGIFRMSNDNDEKFENETIVNPVSKDELDINALKSKVLNGGITDKEFGAYISGSLADKVGEVKELNIITPNSTSQKQLGDRQKLEDIGYGLNNENTYMVLTVKIDLNKFASVSDGLPQNIESLMPKKMLVTFVLKFNDKENKFEYVSFIVNRMASQSRNALIDIIGVDGAVSNLEAVAGECLEPINKVLETISSVPSVRHVFTEDTSNDTSRGNYKVN